MAAKFPLALYTGPNGVKELQSGDTIDPAAAGLTGAYVGTTDTQTLTNKTLTEPKIAVIDDANGVAALSITTTAGAQNGLTIVPSAASDAVQIQATGLGSNLSVNIVPSGTGELQVNGSGVITASSTTTLTNKTHTNPRVSGTVTHSVPFGIGSYPGDCIYTSSGAPVIGVIDAGTAGGVYLGIRNQGATGTTAASSPSMVAAGSDTNINILLQPKGSGVLSVRTPNAGNVQVLNRSTQVTAFDHRALVDPAGGGAAATGRFPLGCLAGFQPGTAFEDIAGVTNNRLYFFPFYAPRNDASSVSLLGFTICTGATNAVAGNVKVAVYSNEPGSAFPGETGTSLVTGSERTVAIPNTGGTRVTDSGMTATLTPGELYWMAFNFDQATFDIRCYPETLPRYPLLGCQDSTTSTTGFWDNTGLVHQMYTGWRAAYAYASAMPANCASGGGLGVLTQTYNVNAGTAPNIACLLIFGS